MLQIIQHQKTGKISVEEVPSPKLRDGHILVRNAYSLISPGTERTSVETARASMLGKVKSRPDLVKQTLENVKREGLRATYRKVQTRLDTYKELGYSSAGVVLESAADGFRVGDGVACAGTAHHAEMVLVPKHLAAPVPDGVDLDEAAFTTLGAIAMQGVRTAEVHLGETVAVIGLGLVGLLTVQLLKAAGCRVVGFDIIQARLKLARELGCDECMLPDKRGVSGIAALTGSHGVDAVILTASSKTSEPMDLGLALARKRAPIVVVGDVRMEVDRKPFYEKELELRISTSYGPGRYDSRYEIDGIDYPIGHVRWTENRNMRSILDLMQQRKLIVKPLVTHRLPVQNGLRAYDLIGRRGSTSLGVLIEYGTPPTPVRSRCEMHVPVQSIDSKLVLGFIGAGNFAQSYLLPALLEHDVVLKGVATSSPVRAKVVASKFGFAYCSADPEEIMADPHINAVFVATRHDSHARYVIQALRHGKHVFVEKPLAVNETQLKTIAKILTEENRFNYMLTTGFNRRFSDALRSILEYFTPRSAPLVMTYRVNAGVLPEGHWMYQGQQGGRIVGEVCHFIDCMSYLAGSDPARVFCEAVAPAGGATVGSDNVSISVRFRDGSLGSILYISSADSSIPKEYLEVSSAGRSAVLDNFSALYFHEVGRKKKVSLDGSKGHKEEVRHFLRVLAGKELPQLSFASMYLTTLTTFKIEDSLRRGKPIDIP